MKYDKKIMAPGPTNVPIRYRGILAEEFPHHRTLAFSALFQKMHLNLKKLLYLDQGEVIFFTSSGSGAMESTVANLASLNDKVLVINIGFFGARYVTMCQRFGLHVIELQYPIGQTYELKDVEATLKEHPDIKAIFVTHHETSSGVLNNLEQLGELTSTLPDVLLIVDSISGFIIHPFYMSQWHIDAVVGGSQKGFLIPPGMSFVGLSEKALQRAKTSNLPRFYWDYQMMLEAAQKGQTPSTPAINLYKAFLQATDDMLKQGLPQIWEHHHQLRIYLEKRIVELGLTLGVTDEAIRGDVVVVVNLPEGTDSTVICRHLEVEHDIIIVSGLGAHAQTQIRVGVIGPLVRMDIVVFIHALKKTLETLYNIIL